MSDTITDAQTREAPQVKKGQQLITDVMSFSASKNKIDEAIRNDEPVLVEGVLQRAEYKNQNGRIYPKEVLQREVKKYQENFINQRRAFGELDHPDEAVVSLKNVSHNVLSVEWDGNDLRGKIQILSTPSGRILRELFRSNVNVGISSRGVGSVNEAADGALVVGTDFELIAWDFVSNPSTQGAFMHKLNEGIKPSNREERIANANMLLQELIQNMSPEYK